MSCAVILSDCDSITKSLTHADVEKAKSMIKASISEFITERHLCVGLKMTHNLYVPSIVLSLQELEHAFMFLPVDDGEAERVINDLGIIWVLSFTITNKSVIAIDLNDATNESVSLEMYNGRAKVYNDISYIIRTSGTTGGSKYVQVSRRCIQSNVECLSRIFNVSSSDRIYFGTPLTFDPSMIELFMALHTRACLLFTTPQNHINSFRLFKTLFDTDPGISILQIVPSVFLRWSQEQIQQILTCSRLKVLAFGGECFPHSILNHPKSESLRIFNLYGITEVSCWASAYEVQANEEVPLGAALDDTLVEVRNDDGRVLQEGEGEIYVGSPTRICYIGDESRDIKIPKFRASGDLAAISKHGIFYKGRKNDEVKRFGLKVRLGEIEKQIEEATGFKNACVWSKEHSKLLVFVINEFLDYNIKENVLDKLRVKLLHSLPKHGFPDYIDMVRKCPTTSNGKTDRRTLESIFANRKLRQTNKVDAFKLLVCKFFGLNVVQLGNVQKCTFFELGGNSILAIQFLSELEDELGSECPQSFVAVLFENDLSACIDHLSSLELTKKRTVPNTTPTDVLVKRSRIQVDMKVAWTCNLDACVDSSPVVFTNKRTGESYVAVGSFSHIFIVANAKSGDLVAKYVLPDVVESSACESANGNYLFVGCFDGKMYCLDYQNSRIEWEYATGDRIKCKPSFCHNNDCIVFGSYDGSVHCITTSSGEAVWTTSIFQSTTSSPVVKNTKIFVATIYGTCFCLDEATGEVNWKYETGSPIFGSPSIFDEKIVWPNVHGRITCLTVQGQKSWQFDCGGHLYSSLVSWQDMLVFGCHDRRLYFLDVFSCEIKQLVDLEDVPTTPCIWGDFIVVAGNSGRVFVVNSGGELVSSLTLPGQVFAGVASYEQNLFVGCRDNNLYCIKIE